MQLSNPHSFPWKWASYCSTCMKPCRRNIFRSPPSSMKVTSRRTTYPRMSMIQRWKRENSAGDQNCSAELFPFVFQKSSDDDFCQTDCVPSNPSGQLVEECEKNNISKTQHEPTVDYRDMATGVLLFLPNSAPLSLAEFFIVSPSFLFFFLFLELVAFGCLKYTFSSNYNYIPHLCLYVFYFIFHVNYPVYFCLNR